MALVSSSDFETLPMDPIKRWLELRDLVEKRLGELIDTQQGASEGDLVEYCTILISAAEELELGKFDNFSVGGIRQYYPTIRAQIIAMATKLNMRSSTANAAFSVALPKASKTKILAQIELLSHLVEKADLPEKQRDKLLSRLNELRELVIAARTDYARLMAVIACIAAGLGGTTAFLADAPAAIATINAVVGDAKEAEEEEHRQLQALREPLKLQDLRSSSETDEKISF